MSHWPERFVYVCSATKAAMIAAMPIRQAGRERVARVVLLCGAPEDSTDPRDRTEALEPMLRLQQYCRHMQVACHVIHGAADDLVHWTRALRHVADTAHAENLPVLFNASTGTGQMRIGALWTPMPGNVRALTVSGRPLHAQLIQDQGGEPVVHDIDADQGFSLDHHLAIRGFRETGAGASAEAEKLYLRNEGRIVTFARTLLANSHLISPLNGAVFNLVRDLRDAERFRPIELLGLPEGIAAAVNTLLADGPIAGIERHRDGSIHLKSKKAVEFLQSGWFEALLYLQIRDLIAGYPDCAVWPNIEIALDAAAAVGEFDILLSIAGQLHAIEAKTSTFGRGGGQDDRGETGQANRRKAIEQMTKARAILQAHACLWLVNPIATEDNLDIAGFGERIAAQGVVIRHGADAVEQLLGDIRQLLDRR